MLYYTILFIKKMRIAILLFCIITLSFAEYHDPGDPGISAAQKTCATTYGRLAECAKNAWENKEELRILTRLPATVAKQPKLPQLPGTTWADTVKTIQDCVHAISLYLDSALFYATELQARRLNSVLRDTIARATTRINDLRTQKSADSAEIAENITQAEKLRADRERHMAWISSRIQTLKTMRTVFKTKSFIVVKNLAETTPGDQGESETIRYDTLKFSISTNTFTLQWQDTLVYPATTGASDRVEYTIGGLQFPWFHVVVQLMDLFHACSRHPATVSTGPTTRYITYTKDQRAYVLNGDNTSNVQVGKIFNLFSLSLMDAIGANLFTDHKIVYETSQREGSSIRFEDKKLSFIFAAETQETPNKVVFEGDQTFSVDIAFGAAGATRYIKRLAKVDPATNTIAFSWEFADNGVAFIAR